MKKGLIAAIGAVVIAGLGFLLLNNYIYQEKQSDVPRAEVAGTVTVVNRDAVAYDGPTTVEINTEEGETHTIAVPSMGLPLCAAYENIADVFSVEVGDFVYVSGDEGEDGSIVPCESVEHFFRAFRTVRDATGLEFDYRLGPLGYVLQELDSGVYTDPAFVKLYTLTLQSDFEAFQAAQPEATEGPATLSVAVFRNGENKSASVWVDQNPSLSNVGLLVGEVNRDAVVGGANAVRYDIDGLYRNSVAVVVHGGYVYLISGAYPSQDSPLFDDFKPLIESVRFVPSTP